MASALIDDSFKDYDLILHWCHILREFEALGIETAQSFKEINKQLAIKYVLKDYNGEELKQLKAEFESYMNK